MPEFEIGYPPIAEAILIMCLSAEAVLFVAFTVCVIKGILEPIIYLVVFIPLALIFLGLYIVKKEKFTLKNGEFKYDKPFKKAQSVKINEIERVDIYHGLLGKVEFYTKNGEKKLYFMDDGTAANNPLFLEAVLILQIKVRHF